MVESFGDKLIELQSDMVSIALEYIEKKADKIYIYASMEDGIISGDAFFEINGALYEKHKVNDSSSSASFDISGNRQKMLMKIIIEDLEKIESLCKQYNQDVPTQYKMIYYVETGKFDSQISYDNFFSHTEDKTSSDIFDEWFDEVKKEVEN